MIIWCNRNHGEVRVNLAAQLATPHSYRNERVLSLLSHASVSACVYTEGVNAPAL